MTKFTALALDPGQTTGWAYYRATKMVTPEGEVEWYDEEWKCGQIGPHEHHNQLDVHLGICHTTEYHIICESFEYRNASKHRDNINLMSREYIGVAKRFAQERNVPLYLQTASQGKVVNKTATRKGSFVQKENLQRLGLWSSGWGHAMDGYGHLLQWMITRTGRPIIGETMRNRLLATGWPNR